MKFQWVFGGLVTFDRTYFFRLAALFVKKITFTVPKQWWIGEFEGL